MYIMKMSEGGRVVIPAEIRHSLGLAEGDPVYFELRDGVAVITSKQARLARARALFRKYVPAGASSLADELIAERRAEAAHEESP